MARQNKSPHQWRTGRDVTNVRVTDARPSVVAEASPEDEINEDEKPAASKPAAAKKTTTAKS